jgi:hypothetical protein
VADGGHAADVAYSRIAGRTADGRPGQTHFFNDLRKNGDFTGRTVWRLQIERQPQIAEVFNRLYPRRENFLTLIEPGC